MKGGGHALCIPSAGKLPSTLDSEHLPPYHNLASICWQHALPYQNTWRQQRYTGCFFKHTEPRCQHCCAQHCKFNICIFWFQAALHVFCCIKFLTLFESHVKHWLAALKLWRFRSYIEGSKFISMCGSYRMPEINFNSMLKRYFLYGALVYAPVSFYSFPNE